MVEQYGEDDLARELEELKLNENQGVFKGTSRAAGDTDDDLTSKLSAPKGRGPPRRKTASNCLQSFPNSGSGAGESGEGQEQ